MDDNQLITEVKNKKIVAEIKHFAKRIAYSFIFFLFLFFLVQKNIINSFLMQRYQVTWYFQNQISYYDFLNLLLMILIIITFIIIIFGREINNIVKWLRKHS